MQEIIKGRPWLAWLIFLGTVVIVFLIGMLASSIVERRQESAALQMVKPIADWEPRNEKWGENYPREYQSYLGTMDTTFRSKYCGSVMIDYLDQDPELVVIWAGYSFSKGYNQGRGHYHAIQDIRNILRTTAPQPATCWTCKSTDVPRVMNQLGVANFYKGTWLDMGPEIYNPIGCQDCHDPKTMNLRITRPALIEAFARQGKDITKATHQEMRSLVCAQCHVEYYFKGKEEHYLTFPWDRGMIVDSIEGYYDRANFSDWTHSLSRAPMLKAQHPDYEMFKTGIHANRGLACADCHMPYRSEGGVKFTNHKIQSPLNDIANACQVCHRESEEQLRNNVYERQDKFEEGKRTTLRDLARAHIEAKFAWDKGATEQEMKPVMQSLRHAQWRWDYVSASNGYSFHSPVESQRILNTCMKRIQDARLQIAQVLAKHGYTDPVPMPDLSNKLKAQNYVGLKIEEMTGEKEKFLRTVVPGWNQKAEERQSKMK
ncbi:MAG: ammonia-forming cytochrome c nitrite reductase [Ignavibacteria bacterium]|nr:ammonia-forming cytochrome c nitrite reductase [Ignavibacteria bacterium]MCU7504246.1 ammonia-forming cytochrome c nitrite reductase [Ignavibacteria bacterium]MCU7516091.1 ammonia-forming cytochrome c nitrite reductase [Ignavibacteria bacterium]